MSTQRKTPLMGWASWNCFRTDISEEKIRDQAEMLVKTGLAECGYTFVNIDDGFLAAVIKTGICFSTQNAFQTGCALSQTRFTGWGSPPEFTPMPATTPAPITMTMR